MVILINKLSIIPLYKAYERNKFDSTNGIIDMKDE